MGNHHFDRSIYVFTFADEYKTLNEAYRSTQGMVKIKNEMLAKSESMKKEFNGIFNKLEKIPVCITSGKEFNLPTSLNWVPDLWNMCINRQKPYESWWKRNYKKVGMGAGAGAAVGAGAGAAVGSIIPIVGTAVGAVIGAIFGAAGFGGLMSK